MKPSGQHPHKRLSALQVRNLTKPGRYADGDGLYLMVDASGARRWIMRIMVQGKRKDLGLGGASTVSLKEARDKAQEMHTLIRSGKDPVSERKTLRRVIPTFAEAATTVHSSMASSWKNAKHGAQWINTINTYATPLLGTRRIDAIGTPEILTTLQPIWREKPETARRVKQRLQTIFDWAKAAGFREGENPVDGVERGLPKQTDEDEHHKALPYDQVGQFLRDLRQSPSGSIPKLGFEFLILSATRTNEVLGAKWNEIDMERACWTIPADRMKAGKEHRVPLSERCVEILRAAEQLRDDGDYVFPGRSQSKPLSNMAFLQIVRRMNLAITPHGFRSTFRDWAAEQTHFPNEVCEQALAHTISNKVEAAYRRTDLFEKRKELMAAWCTFVLTD